MLPRPTCRCPENARRHTAAIPQRLLNPAQTSAKVLSVRQPVKVCAFDPPHKSIPASLRNRRSTGKRRGRRVIAYALALHRLALLKLHSARAGFDQAFAAVVPASMVRRSRIEGASASISSRCSRQPPNNAPPSTPPPEVSLRNRKSSQNY